MRVARYNRPRSLAALDWLHTLLHQNTYKLLIGVVLAYVGIVLMVAGADGLSEAEKQWLRDRSVALGLPAQSLASLEGFFDDAGKLRASSAAGNLSRSGEGQPGARALLLDALTLAAQDGLSDEEAERAAHAARALGVEKELLDEAIALVHEEAELRVEKQRLLLDPARGARTSA